MLGACAGAGIGTMHHAQSRATVSGQVYARSFTALRACQYCRLSSIFHSSHIHDAVMWQLVLTQSLTAVQSLCRCAVLCLEAPDCNVFC